jgi:type I restriction-modification system DNA methylase subunit
MPAASPLPAELGFAPGTYAVYGPLAADLTALQRHYIRAARRFGTEARGADQVYFSGEQPAVYFKSVPDFSPEVVAQVVELQRKIWNQGKVPLLYVDSPSEVRVYNCYEKPRSPHEENAEADLRLTAANRQTQAALRDLATVFDKVAVESGVLWQTGELARRITSKNRVLEALTTNLKTTRQRLRAMGLRLPVVHDLLLRSLFVLYLEDRQATDEAFYEGLLPGATSYFDVLQDVPATYRLFAKLEKAFNGNLCPVQAEERDQVTAAHLAQLSDCFYSELATAQLRLFDWRIFDFEVIPIHLISEIYEDFLRAEDGADHMRQQGAFYTPHTLAEFVLNEVLPYPTAAQQAYDVRVLDPTCGSGIFLVESLNRLLDRWEHAHPDRSLAFADVQQLVLDNIFGIEIEEEAIKVAAFSLYLAMLDRLDPKTLWQEVHFPYLIHRSDGSNARQQGHNLFLQSSLQPGTFEETSFDLIVGNPPFTNKVSPEVRAYLQPLGFAKETVLAFLHRATTLCPTGRIALISTSKILFNTGGTYQEFRRFLFGETYVEKVFNFSALRRAAQQHGGRNLFASAQRPVCLLLYQKPMPAKPSRRLVYCCPTTAVKNRLIDGITLDPSEIKYLPRTECQNPATKIWKTAMWATVRDFELVRELTSGPTLDDYLTEAGFAHGVGFETSPIAGNNQYQDDLIATLPHVEAAALSRYYTTEDCTNRLRDTQSGAPLTQFRRLGLWSAFQGPHVLIKEGQSKNQFCASYLDYDCSFRRTVYGVAKPGQEDDLKLLTAFLNSEFATYLLFLTASDWGVERERVSPNEMLSLPSLCFQLPDEAKHRMVQGVNALIQLHRHHQPLVPAVEQEQIEQDIENALWDGLGLVPTDRLLIESVLRYRLDAFQRGRASQAYAPASATHSRYYATVLCEAVNRFLTAEGALVAQAAYYTIAPNTPLQVVALYLDGRANPEEVTELPATGLHELLRAIEAYTYQEAAESIYYRRFVRYYQHDVVYLVKPNEQRCWSPANALNDADDLIAEIISQAAWVQE